MFQCVMLQNYYSCNSVSTLFNMFNYYCTVSYFSMSREARLKKLLSGISCLTTPAHKGDILKSVMDYIEESESDSYSDLAESDCSIELPADLSSKVLDTRQLPTQHAQQLLVIQPPVNASAESALDQLTEDPTELPADVSDTGQPPEQNEQQLFIIPPPVEASVECAADHSAKDPVELSADDRIELSKADVLETGQPLTKHAQQLFVLMPPVDDSADPAADLSAEDPTELSAEDLTELSTEVSDTGQQ